MKTFLLSMLSCAVAIGPVMGAQDQDDPQPPKSKNRVAPAPPRHVNAPRTVTPRVQNNLAPKPQFQPQNKPPVTARTYAPPRSYTPEIQARLRDNSPKFTPADRNTPGTNTTMKPDASVAHDPNWRSPNRTNTNVVTPQAPNTTVRNRDWRNRDNNNHRNWNNNNRNWNNNTSGTFTFEQARRHHHRDRHDRGWWRSRYNRISLFGGGYYYWDNNYWYPAYGYDPYYSTYTYDEPIYGYNNLEPGQVIANVQTALQEQGYYDDAVDGLIGPRTRAALSNFQRDHRLAITAAIDGPTLQALGLY